MAHSNGLQLQLDKQAPDHCFSNFPVHLQILIQKDRGSWGLRSCSSGKVPKTADAVNPFTACPSSGKVPTVRSANGKSKLDANLPQ